MQPIAMLSDLYVHPGHRGRGAARALVLAAMDDAHAQGCAWVTSETSQGLEGIFERYVDEVYRHMWCEPKKMDDLEVIAAALEESGLPAGSILAGTQEPEVKRQLIENTEDSVRRGVFGSPSFFVGEELYFGKDRLREVEEEIERSSAAANS